MGLKQGLIKDGVIKIYKENTPDQAPYNDKPWYWKKNKNSITDSTTNTW